jgi:hypothetical protein
MQKQQRPAGKRTADFTGIGPKLLDDPQVAIILWITHLNLLSWPLNIGTGARLIIAHFSPSVFLIRMPLLLHSSTDTP